MIFGRGSVPGSRNGMAVMLAGIVLATNGQSAAVPQFISASRIDFSAFVGSFSASVIHRVAAFKIEIRCHEARSTDILTGSAILVFGRW